MKKIIQLKLKILAKMILARYKPEIIGITGSVGKTSAKEAIFAVLSVSFKVGRSQKNYNNEIGLPLTIIGAPAPGRSLLKWFFVFARAVRLILFKDKNYPDILILEMGADKPGDIKYLLSIARPNIGVITRIGESHFEFFSSFDDIKKEKETLVKNLAPEGWAVLNNDDENLRGLAGEIKSKVITYGFSAKSQVKIREINSLSLKSGASFKVEYDGSVVPIQLPGVVGRPAVYAGLAGIALGVIHKINLVKIAEALKNFKPPAGRLNLIAGIKNTLIIDDTYNSSPQSSLEALSVFADMNLPAGSRRLAVLGDMLELGSYTEEGHRLVGRKVAEARIDKLIIVGERARDIGREAQARGMKADNIFYFPEATNAGRFLQDRLRSGDIVLVKGSRGMRMDKIVKEVMADPLRADELLVGG